MCTLQTYMAWYTVCNTFICLYAGSKSLHVIPGTLYKACSFYQMIMLLHIFTMCNREALAFWSEHCTKSITNLVQFLSLWKPNFISLSLSHNSVQIVLDLWPELGLESPSQVVAVVCEAGPDFTTIFMPMFIKQITTVIKLITQLLSESRNC